MPYGSSWDPKSSQEFNHWLEQQPLTDKGVLVCEKLLIPLKKGIYDNGAEAGSSPCATGVIRLNGNSVDIHCETKEFDYFRCVAIDGNAKEYRLLIIGPFHKQNLIKVARARAERW